MNRQQSPEMNTSNNNDSFAVLQDVDVLVEENCSKNEHFENPCDILSTIEEENSNDISDSDSTSIHSLEFLLDGTSLEETIGPSDCRRNGPRSQPRKQVNLNHTISSRDRDVGGSYQEVHWGKSGVACESSHSLRSLSSRATLSTASLSRSSSSLSSSSLSSSRVQHLQNVHETPQPNEVFNLEPKDQHQWIGENIEISRTEDLFDSISSLDACICSDTAGSSSLLEKTTIRSQNDDKIPYDESDDEFADDPQWFQREVLRRQLESRIQMIERTIVKLRLAKTTGN